MKLESLTLSAIKEHYQNFAEGCPRLSIHHQDFVSEETILRTLSQLSKLNYSPQIKARFLTPPSSFSNESRRALWFQSRASVIEVMQEALDQHLLPEHTLLSLSHTQGASIAILNENKNICAVGVDLESCKRMLSEKVVKKFVREHELSLGLSALQLWVIKESSYKADPNHHASVIADYEITELESQPAFCQGTVKIKNKSQKFILFLYENNDEAYFWISLAKSDMR